MYHSDLIGSGVMSHDRIDAALDPSGNGYGITDALCLESSLLAPGSGVAPSRTTYHNNFSLWSFPDAANEAAQRYLQSTVQLPHSYVPNTPLLFHVHFIPDTTNITDGQTVTFNIDVTYGSTLSTFSQSSTYTTTFTSSGVSTAGSATTPGRHCKTTSVSIPVTLSGSGFVLARIYRVAGDTYGGAVWMLGADYHIRVNRLGTAGDNPYT